MNLLTNGSFESSSVPSGGKAITNGITGWTASNKVEVRNNLSGTAFDGSNFAELDADSNSSTSQTVNSVIGQWYTLSFEYSNRMNIDPCSNGLGVENHSFLNF